MSQQKKHHLRNSTAKFYNLDAIIAVGFPVNSTCASRFRKCSVAILRDFVISKDSPALRSLRDRTVSGARSSGAEA